MEARAGPVPVTHMDVAGDHGADSTVLEDAEVVLAVSKCGPVVIDVPEVDGHRGDGRVPTD